MYVLKDFRAKDSISVEEIPIQCPFCNLAADYEKNVVYLETYMVYDWSGDNYYADVVFRCASRLCHRLFIYGYRDDRMTTETNFKLRYKSEYFKSPPHIPETVAKLSPKFVEIFTQADSAKKAGLTEIMGLGYRKSFEFLIKDYVLKNIENEKENIKKSVRGEYRLQNIITSYFSDNKRVQEIAKRVGWLGNDHAHYDRIQLDHGVEDLLVLIHIVMNHIDNELTADHYIQTIQPKK